MFTNRKIGSVASNYYINRNKKKICRQIKYIKKLSRQNAGQTNAEERGRGLMEHSSRVTSFDTTVTPSQQPFSWLCVMPCIPQSEA